MIPGGSLRLGHPDPCGRAAAPGAATAVLSN